VILGHEIAGVVDAVGSGVASVAEGDLVTVQPNLFCGSCYFCRLGREHLCLHRSAIGVDLDGGLAEALVAPASSAYRLPRGLDARIGCLAEPVACCLHGVDRLAPLDGLPLLIFGAGPAGLILLRLARLQGAAPIVAVEPNEARRAAARTFGAHHVLDPTRDDWRELALALSGGHGFDAVIEAVGAVTTFEAAIALAASGGKVLVFGAAPAEALAQVRPHELFARELTLIGTVINPRTQERAVEMLAALGLDAMTIATFPLEHAHEAFDAHVAGTAAKVEVLPQGTA
jgi:threonine dehydrogenase-like Zn-dependent dehydrogenase